MSDASVLVRLALLEQQLAFEKEVRAAQAVEYERRLGILNHAHEQAVEVQHNYLNNEIYSRDHKEVIGRLDKMERAAGEQRAQYAVIGLILTLALAITTVVINVILRFVFK